MGEAKNGYVMPYEIDMGETLRVRFLESSDGERLHEILQSDPSIQTRVTWTAGKDTADDIHQTIEGFRRRQELRFGIVEADKVVGYVGMFPSPRRQGGYDIGYFSDPSVRGKGYVSKALESLIRTVEASMPVTYFGLYIADDNPASQAIARRLDFQRTEELLHDPILDCVERRYERVASTLAA